VLDWAAQAQVAVVPFGGGTSVVGGVEPAVGDRFAGVVALDLGALVGVAEVDPVSRAARVLAGTTGPALEAALGQQGLTLRFFPQSFERSTVGASEESNAPTVRSLAPTQAGGRGGVVADIAKLSVGREEYYTRELATDHEQYLSGHGESPGRCYGAGAAHLGL
jgi:FAD binding domain